MVDQNRKPNGDHWRALKYVNGPYTLVFGEHTPGDSIGWQMYFDPPMAEGTQKRPRQYLGEALNLKSAKAFCEKHKRGN